MARRGMGRRQTWAGAAVGAVALALVLVLILFGRDSGGGGRHCDSPLPLLVEIEVDAARFAEAESALARLVSAAEAGDLRAADEAFFADGVHAFTHAVDAKLRGDAPELARPICEGVLAIEDAFVEEDVDEAARQARRIDAALRAAAPSFAVTPTSNTAPTPTPTPCVCPDSGA